MADNKQIFPEFEADLLIMGEKDFLDIYANDIIAKKLADLDLKINIKEIDKERYSSGGEWIQNISLFNLYINDNFIRNHFEKSTEDVTIFLENFRLLIHPLAQILSTTKLNTIIESKRPFASFSTFYKTKEGFILQYLFDIDGDEDKYITALEDVFKSIKLYNEIESNAFQKAIRNAYSKSNKVKYLLYVDAKWNVLDPIIEVVTDINARYKRDKDFRIKKPHILIHRENYHKYFVLDENWILAFDDLETLMIKPNDVSLYSNISDINLKKAKDFYNETILPRYKKYYGSFPPLEKQREYYDFFELIITSLIFSYTSIEAFANTCIPNEYEYLIEKDGVKTIYSKQAIELNFSLREKFKNILKSILNTPDLTQEKWWNPFIFLENLRNEIIHTKQSKAEERYSKLLSKKIFDIIEVHKEIIKFYGYYISENKKELLEEFPYNFGYDAFFPGLMDDKGYENSKRVLHNIPT